VLNKHKTANRFELTITETHFAYRRKTRQIAEEAALDGLTAVRTSLPEQTLEDAATVGREVRRHFWRPIADMLHVSSWAKLESSGASLPFRYRNTRK
jgi:hypothetical protein